MFQSFLLFPVGMVIDLVNLPKQCVKSVRSFFVLPFYGIGRGIWSALAAAVSLVFEILACFVLCFAVVCGMVGAFVSLVYDSIRKSNL